MTRTEYESPWASDGWGAAAPPDPPGLRLRAMMPMADALKIYSRSNGHNSLQFRPLSMKILPNYTKFRDATREATPEAAAPQIRQVSVFFRVAPSVSSFFDETWCGKKSSPRRICMQNLGWIRAKSSIFVPEIRIFVKKIWFFA